MTYKLKQMYFGSLLLTILTGLLIACLSGCEKPQTVMKKQLSGKTDSSKTNQVKPQEYSFKVIRKIKSDPQAFTQGFVVHDGLFYIGTGGNRFSSKTTGKQSFIIKMDIRTGTVLFKKGLDQKYFGEGITILNDYLYQLTWKNRIAFVYPVNRLNIAKPLRTFRYASQGWGLTHDGKKLIMSDGTAALYFMEPETFKVDHRIIVKDQGKPLLHLNELEFVEGEVFANIYQKDRVARICPVTGRVTGWIDFSGLRATPAKFPGQDVLNGIAYDRQNHKLYLTGKLWDYIYEVTIINRS